MHQDPSLQSLLTKQKSKLSHQELTQLQNFTPEKIKIAVIGSGGIGKSALSLQYVQSLFSDGYDPTLQDYYSKKAFIFNQYVDLEILDTAGQDEFSLLRNEYMRGQDGFLLCFSLDSKSSFCELRKFYKEIYRAKLPPGSAIGSNSSQSQSATSFESSSQPDDSRPAGPTPNRPPVPIFLIATKCDLPQSSYQISDNDISQKLHQLGLNLKYPNQNNNSKLNSYTDHRFFKTSAKQAINVSEAFEALAEEIFEMKREEFLEEFERERRKRRKFRMVERVSCGVCKISWKKSKKQIFELR